jgi:26S proteasome regulatory subunit N3
METDSSGASVTSSAAVVAASTPSTSVTRLRGAKSALTPLLPEVDCYLHLLILLHLLDNDGDGSGKNIVQCAEELMKKIVVQNRRSLDHIAARCYYYYTRSFEKVGDIGKIRGLLHSRLRTATLRNDFEGQAVLINCLLRSYIDHNLFDQVS